MAKNVKELRKWNFTRNLKYRKPRQIMSVPGLVPKHQEMRLNWHYVYPPWARGLEDEALGTMPKEFCPRRSLKSGRWYKAEMSAMQIADLRKTVLLSGGNWPWEKPGRRGLVRIERVPKGHKQQAAILARKLMVKSKMEDMPRKLAEMRKARAARKDATRDDLWSELLRGANIKP